MIVRVDCHKPYLCRAPSLSTSSRGMLDRHSANGGMRATRAVRSNRNKVPERKAAKSSPMMLGSGALLVLATAALLFLPLGNGYRALWHSAALDAGHVALFGLLTFLGGKYCWPRHQIVVMILAATMACSAEIIQPLVGRSASWRDLAYGFIGIGIAMVWLRNSRPLWQRLAVSAILAAWPIERTAPLLLDAGWAWASFPMLAGDDSPWERRRWLLQNVKMTQEQSAVRLAFGPDKHGSSAILLPVVRDWTDYQSLEVDFAFEGEPLLFLISVRDGKRLPPELPRFDLWRRYPPGRHHVRIDLSELERGGRFPPIDLQHIQSLHLVAYSEHLQVVDLHRIQLACELSILDPVNSTDEPPQSAPPK